MILCRNLFTHLAFGLLIVLSTGCGRGPSDLLIDEQMSKPFHDFNLSWGQDQAQSTISIDLQADCSRLLEVVKTPEGLFSYIAMEGGQEIRVAGYPAVKQVRLAFHTQPDQDYQLVVTNVDYEEIDFELPYLPSKGPITRDQDPDCIPREVANESIVDGFYPFDFENFVRADGHFLIRQVRGYNLSVAPIMVDTLNQKARVLKHISIELRSTRTKNITNRAPEKPKVCQQNLGLYQNIFQNFRWNNEISDGKGDILVIYTQRDSSAIWPYVTHKQGKGFTVHTRQVATRTNVKSLIQTEYDNNNNILYVLTVGDWDDIKCDTLDGSPADTEMGMVAGSDNYVDIIVGRFSAESAEQVTTLVNKTIEYENNPNQAFWRGSLGIGSNEGYSIGDDSEKDRDHIDIIMENKLKPNGWTTTYKEYGAYATKAGITNAVNSGVQVINYTGHGGGAGWKTGGFYNSGVNALSNGDKLPFILAVACKNGTYHTGTCFAETWLRKQNGGAVAALMATIDQPWVPPMIGHDYMNDLLSGGYDYTANPGNGISTDHGKTRLGSIVFNAFNLWYAESNSASDLETIQTWILFGDPALQVKVPIDLPVAGFTHSVKNLIVDFKDTSNDTGTITDWYWQFGDGATSIQQNPSHTYASVGTETVTLTVTDNDGNSDSIKKSIIIGSKPPNAEFAFIVDLLAVDFTETCTDNGKITAWDWNFGDGNTSTAQNPTHTYQAPGTYDVTLQVYDNEDLTGFVTKAVTVNDIPDYCVSNGTNTNHEWIAKVELGTFVNLSGTETDGYGDHTNQVIQVFKGQNYPVTLTPGFGSSVHKVYWKVWIDWNRDGDFFDTGEEVLMARDNKAVSNIVSVPNTAVTNTTRMRVSLSYLSAALECGEYGYGEVEDYSVAISEQAK